ncbi:hypothetical protein [Nocardiopsis halophila]|uniref:hypothetical protein n=1 Tax=Nocardiopsis halophila TaxID=141692 RepID=UPI00034B390F|nr:hypothetical protein [Nocardiopsis halophila]
MNRKRGLIRRLANRPALPLAGIAGMLIVQGALVVLIPHPLVMACGAAQVLIVSAVAAYVAALPRPSEGPTE